MRLILFVAALLLGLVPGLPGAIEDAAHLLAEGHTLHDDHHDADASAENGDGHDEDSGCEDCGHEGLCHCHGHVSLAAAPIRSRLVATPTLSVLSVPALAHRPTHTPVDGLERPPRS